MHEVAETSGFLTPSFIGAHPDPHCWTLQNSLIHIQTFSLAGIEIAGLSWSSNPSEVSLWGRGGPGGHLVREESRYAETSVTSSLRGKLLIKGFKRPRSRPDTEVVSRGCRCKYETWWRLGRPPVTDGGAPGKPEGQGLWGSWHLSRGTTCVSSSGCRAPSRTSIQNRRFRAVPLPGELKGGIDC